MFITTFEVCWLLTFLITIYNLTFNGSSSSQVKKRKMSAISILKKASIPKPFKSFKDLQEGKYKVERFDLVETNFGDRVRIKTNDAYMYLPERYAEEMTEEVINELNTSSVTMIYSGKDPENQNRLMLDFDAVGYNEEGAPDTST